MSRTVDLIVTLDLELDLANGRPVVAVAPARWNHVPDEVSESEVEQAADLLLIELAPLLADVTGELEGGQG